MNFNPLLRRAAVPFAAVLAVAATVPGVVASGRAPAFAVFHPSIITTTTTTTRRTKTSCLYDSSASSGQAEAVVSSLLPLVDASTGKSITSLEDPASTKLRGKRIAYYFSAGWCPMCTSFEPSLLQFQQAINNDANYKENPIEFIYVPSDRSAEIALQRANSLQMTYTVPYDGEDGADKLKKQFGIWSGSESLKFGFGGRRSGVPALIVLDGANGEELAFLPAESQGPAALKSWPLEDKERGIFW